MTTYLTDGFGMVGDGAAVDLDFYVNWLSIGGATVVDMGDGRKYATIANLNGMHMVSKTFASLTTFHVGMRYWWTGSASLVAWLRGSGSVAGTLGVQATGKVMYGIHNTSVTGSVKLVSTDALNINAWNYIEWKVVLHNSAGTVDIWINGLPSGSVTGVDTVSDVGSFDQLYLAPNTASSDFAANDRITDVYVDDDFRGPQKYLYRPAAGVGTYSTFTAVGDATIWECIDEIGVDSDTTYAKSTAAAQKFGVLCETVPAGTIKVVQPIIIAKKPLAGAATLAVGMRSGTTDDTGTAQAVAEGAYGGLAGDFYAVDPDTGVAWITAGINAAELLVTSA